MDVVGKNLYIFSISETKIDETFPEAHFFMKGLQCPLERWGPWWRSPLVYQ